MRTRRERMEKSDWRRFCGGIAIGLCLVLPARSQDSVEVALGEPEPLPRQLYAFNANLLMATAFKGITFDGSEFRRGLADLKPTGLRFPGGTTANNYLWREDSFSLQKDDKTEWAAQQLELFRKIGKKYGLPGYAKICREFGMAPIYVLNVYEETPESVVEMFERFDELGLDVRAIEMGNEPYWDPRSLMNVRKYVEYCRPLAEAIRKSRPEVKIGACFGPVRKDSVYAEKWNAPLAKQSWYDAAVYHEYYGGQGFAMEEGVGLSLEAVLHPEGLVDEAVKHLSGVLPGKPIWFTEWNIGQEGLKRWKNTGAELLFLGAVVVRILEHREAIEWSCFHQIFEANFGAFYHDKETGIQTLPSYEFFRMLGAAWAGAETLRSVDFREGGKLRGFATGGEGGLRLFVVNCGAAGVELALPEGLREKVEVRSIEVEPEAKLPQSAGLTRTLPITGGKLSLPAYSISLIALPPVIKAAERVEIEKSENLFPVRPHLTFWYPPYAAKQPRVAPEGSFAVDFSRLTDKKTAVLKMNLSGLSLETGGRYTVSFEAKAEPGVGLVARKPGRGGGEGDWIQLSPGFQKNCLEFAYEPETNEGELSFLFTESAIARGGTVEFRNFALTRAAEGPAE